MQPGIGFLVSILLHRACSYSRITRRTTVGLNATSYRYGNGTVDRDEGREEQQAVLDDYEARDGEEVESGVMDEGKKKTGLIVISGPSGSGKGFLTDHLLQGSNISDQFEKVVSYTTRKMRNGEKNGVHYNFVSEEEFKDMIKNGKFLEHAQVYKGGARYGKSKIAVQKVFDKGKHAVMEMDIGGATTVREMSKDEPYPIRFIFIEPPGSDLLESRLRARSKANGTTTEAQILKRLSKSIKEIETKNKQVLEEGKQWFTVINADGEKAKAEFVGLCSAPWQNRESTKGRKKPMKPPKATMNFLRKKALPPCMYPVLTLSGWWYAGFTCLRSSIFEAINSLVPSSAKKGRSWRQYSMNLSKSMSSHLPSAH